MFETPTADELRRVAAYWRQVKQLACHHSTITYMSGADPTCGDCDRPVRILSDVQIESLKGAEQ